MQHSRFSRRNAYRFGSISVLHERFVLERTELESPNKQERKEEQRLLKAVQVHGGGFATQKQAF